jgi:putative aldouronate transport system substrate-binding protein
MGGFQVNKKKRVSTTLLAATLALTLLAGCAGGNNGSNTNEPASGNNKTTPPTTNTTPAPEKPENPYLISEKPIELGIHLHFWDSQVFDDSWEVYQEAAKLTNVSLKGTAPKSASKSKEVFSLMLASGDIPDIVHYENRTELTKYGLEGAFLDLAPLIDEHAPNLKKFLEDNEDVKKAISTLEGQIFVIPYMPDGSVAQGWHMRQDWLDALKLEQPKTVDEYVEVLRAFRDKDPNGNGKADEVPYFNRDVKHGPYRPLIFWNASKDWRAVGDKVVYGPMEPQFKTAMIELAKWYKDGLVDKEIFTRGNTSRDVLFGDNLGGSTHDWFTSTINYNNSLKDQVPGFKITAIAPPAGTDGVQREETSRSIVNGTGWSISSDSKYAVEAIKYFDFWFTEKGRTMQNYGIEGKSFDMVDGKPTLRPEIFEGSFGSNLQKYGAFLEVGFHQDYAAELQAMNPDARSAVELYQNNEYPVKPFPRLNFTLEQQQVVSNLSGNIGAYVSEQMQKWMLGAESVEDTYDNFIKGLKDLNFEELEKVYQAAYDAYMKQ